MVELSPSIWNTHTHIYTSGVIEINLQSLKTPSLTKLFKNIFLNIIVDDLQANEKRKEFPLSL